MSRRILSAEASTTAVLARMLEAVLLCGLAMLVAFLQTASSSGFGQGSMTYIDVARHVAKGQGVTTDILFVDSIPRVPTPLSNWPPLYPVAIAGLARFGLDFAIAARWVAIAGAGGAVVLVYLLGAMLFGPRAGRISAVLMTVWPAITRIAAMAMSEPLFLLLLLTSVLITVWSIPVRGAPGYVRLALGGLILGAAALTRYPGAALIPAGGIALLAGVPGWRWRERVGRALAWSLPAAVPIAAWLARNLFTTGALVGVGRQPSKSGLIANAVRAVKTVAFDTFHLMSRITIVPELVHIRTRLVALVTAAVVGALLIWLLRDARRRVALKLAVHNALGSPERAFVAAIGGGYVAAMVIARSLSSFEPLGSRMMLPAYPFLLILIIAFVTGLQERLWPKLGGWLAAGVTLLCLASVAVVVLPESLRAGGPSLEPGPAPAWVEWAAVSTSPDAVIVGNIAGDYNLYLQRPALTFSNYESAPSHFDCVKISKVLSQLESKRAYFVLHKERGELQAGTMGSQYGKVIEHVLTGQTRLPLKLIVRQPEFAAYEILSPIWPCSEPG